MKEKRRIVIIGAGIEDSALIKAKGLAEKQGIEIITPEEATEMGFNPDDCQQTKTPVLQITNPRIEDFEIVNYPIETKNKFPTKKNWKQKLKKNRKK